MDYWKTRAKKAGLSTLEIVALTMQSDEALSDAVRKLEHGKRSGRESKISVEGNTLEFSVAFAVDHKDSKLTKRRLELKNGNYLEVYAHEDFGMIREYDLNLVLACFKIGQKNKYKQYEITPHELLAQFGKYASGRDYEELDRAFDRLGACYIKTNNWYNPESKKRVSLARFNFFQILIFDENIGKYTIRFSEWVEQSIEGKYLKQIDMTVAQKLRGASKIIHLNLIKLIGQKRYFEISEELALRWLGRWDKYQTMTSKKYNQNVKRYIDPGVSEAVNAMGFEVRKEAGIYQIMR